MLVNFKSEKKILQRSQGLTSERKGRKNERESEKGRKEGRKSGMWDCRKDNRQENRKSWHMRSVGEKIHTHTTNKSSGGCCQNTFVVPCVTYGFLELFGISSKGQIESGRKSEYYYFGHNFIHIPTDAFILALFCAISWSIGEPWCVGYLRI